MNAAKTIAEHLLKIKAIKLQAKQPFTWASGWKSPIYCDNRIALSHPKVRTFIRQELVRAINQNFPSVELIAGVATAAIAQGVLVAEAMGLPFVYVRSSPKDHGRENLIEGEVREGQSVVVIEDLVSTGKSSLKAVAALKDAGCNVKGMVCIFNYGFEESAKNFEDARCELISLCDYSILLEQAAASEYIRTEDVTMLEEWRSNPAAWGADQKEIEYDKNRK